jgi:archaeal preflagellin peptidase FlaK
MNSLILEDIGIASASVMLLFTSYLDLKKREVEDKVWLIFGAFGAVLIALEILQGYLSLQTFGISIGLAAVAGFGLFFLGFYGGADGKALIILALFVPQYVQKIELYSIAPLIVLTNGVLLSIVLPISLLILNMTRLLQHQDIFQGFDEPFHRKLLACVLGFKQTGKPRAFQFTMERLEEHSDGSSEPHKKFDFSLMQDDFETKGGTWVTPGIPLLVFFTAGFFAMLVYGDLVIGLVQFFAEATGV